MRIPDNIVTPPVILIGWLLTFMVLFYITRVTPKIDNKELARMATVGAYIFVISIIQIPILPLPIGVSLSGVTLALLLFGMRKGSLVATSAIILNHLIIPGALGALGVNLVNMLAIAMLMGFIAHKVIEFKQASRRTRYLIAFFTGFLYVVLEGLIILGELALMHTTDADIKGIFLVFLLYLALIGTLEGFFTAMSYSFYNRSSGSSYSKRLVEDLQVDTTEQLHEVKIDVEMGDKDDEHEDKAV